jgi:hypothetical protein
VTGSAPVGLLSNTLSVAPTLPPDLTSSLAAFWGRVFDNSIRARGKGNGTNPGKGICADSLELLEF